MLFCTNIEIIYYKYDTSFIYIYAFSSFFYILSTLITPKFFSIYKLINMNIHAYEFLMNEFKLVLF